MSFFFCEQGAALCKFSIEHLFLPAEKNLIENSIKNINFKNRFNWFCHKERYCAYKFSNGLACNPNYYTEEMFLLERIIYFTTSIILQQELPQFIPLLKFFKFTGANAAVYQKGKTLGWHDDAEPIFNPRIIASLSFFSNCMFAVKAKKGKMKHEFSLRPYDILLMIGKDFQKNFLHSVTKTTSYRVNFTFRHILQDRDER